MDEFRAVSNYSSEAANYRARKIDAQSIEKFRRDPEKLVYLAQIRPKIGPSLDWIGKTYDYDLSL